MSAHRTGAVRHQQGTGARGQPFQPSLLRQFQLSQGYYPCPLVSLLMFLCVSFSASLCHYPHGLLLPEIPSQVQVSREIPSQVLLPREHKLRKPFRFPPPCSLT